MSVDNVPAVTDVDDLHDKDIPTEKKCSLCGSQIVSYPDCTYTCSNPKCESHHIRIDV